MHWKLAAGLALAAVAFTMAGYGTVSSRHSARLAQAHDLVVEGRLYSARLTADAQRSAISSFERALALDPRSAPAHAGLALAYIGLAFDGGTRRQDAYPKAAKAAQTAIALDTQSAEAHTAMAEVRYRIEQDRHQAEAEYRRALALDPTSVDGHWRFGRFLYLHGRFTDGEAEIRKALTLDPLSVQANYQLECVKYYRRDYHAAIAQGRRTLELDQRYAWAHHVLGLALEAEHEYDEAFAEFEKSQRGPSGNLGHAYAVAGRRAEALKILDQLKSRYEREGVGPGSVAQVYIGLGEFDRALEWLNTAVGDDSAVLTLGVAPLFDPLRSDPRFEELLRRSGLID